MGTQLVLLVGTNPLPVWVAWHHLRYKLPQPVCVRFVHTAGTKDEKERLEKHCQSTEFLAPIETSEGKPDVIRRNIRDGIRHDIPQKVSFLHVHYTGGTKAMAVEAVVAALKAIEISDQIHGSLDISYLDPRAGSGPTIVKHSGAPWIVDARKDVDANLSLVAQLNGFEIKKCSPMPTREELESARTKLRTHQVVGEDSGHDGTWLEHAAYDAFQQALEEISNHNNSRANYALFHSVEVHRKSNIRTLNSFELDVVAVLGYQIVVVSCSTSAFFKKRRDLKLKAMEAIARARQLGGVEARAVLLCRACPKTAREVQEELEDETGSLDYPLQVWGTTKLHNLNQSFYKWLRTDLRWH